MVGPTKPTHPFLLVKIDANWCRFMLFVCLYICGYGEKLKHTKLNILFSKHSPLYYISVLLLIRAQEAIAFFLHCYKLCNISSVSSSSDIGSVLGVLRPWFFPIWVSTLKSGVSLTLLIFHYLVDYCCIYLVN